MTKDEKPTRRDWQDLQQGQLVRASPYYVNKREELFDENGGCGDNPSLPYRQLDIDGSDDDRVWFESTYASGSDYSGGLPCESNYRVLVKMCEDHDEEHRDGAEQTFWQTLYGAYGTYSIVFHIDHTPREIFDVLCALEDYPIIDESDWSDLEHERETEAWKQWGAHDFGKALIEHHDLDEDCLDELGADDLFTYWSEACEADGWHCEHSAEGPHFNFSAKVLDAVDLDSLLAKGAA